jgi:hypothetical protein
MSVRVADVPHGWTKLLRAAVGPAILGVLVWHLGLGPFIEGVRAAGPTTIAAAVLITAGTTWCCAQRWRVVSSRWGEPIPLRVAYAAYYRSQLVNATLPGGVVGDVHRGLRHGWRAVLWERAVGQVVQLGLVGALLLPGAWRWAGLAALLVLVAAGGAIALLSALSTLGHLTVFLVAAASTGAGLPVSSLLSVAALVLLGAAIPLNVAGWGPREGVAAWAFAAFGSTAAVGLAVAVTFGVVATLATLPGLAFHGRTRD